MNIQCATSFDERYDPKNVLDVDNMGTYWMTTGLYPQELLISLDRPKSVYGVKFCATGGKYNI